MIGIYAKILVQNVSGRNPYYLILNYNANKTSKTLILCFERENFANTSLNAIFKFQIPSLYAFKALHISHVHLHGCV